MLGVLTLTLLNSGCAGIPLASMVKLRNVEPQTTDVSMIRVAVKIPMSIVPSGKGVYVLMKLEKTARMPELREVFILEALPLAQFAHELVHYRHPDYKLLAYRIPAKDVELFEHIRGLKDADGVRRHGQMRVRTQFCRVGALKTEQGGKPAAMLTSVFLKTAETKKYVPIVVDKDLNALLGDEAL